METGTYREVHACTHDSCHPGFKLEITERYKLTPSARQLKPSRGGMVLLPTKTCGTLYHEFRGSIFLAKDIPTGESWDTYSILIAETYGISRRETHQTFCLTKLKGYLTKRPVR